MKSLTFQLLNTLLRENTSRGVVSTDADYQKVVSRVKNEGDSFLTITLPAFGKHFDKCLSEGKWSPIDGFKHRLGLPVFLQGFLRLIFDESGCVIESAPADVISLLRQILYLFKKVKAECTPLREYTQFSAYVDSNQEVEDGFKNIPIERFEDYQVFTAFLGSTYFRDLDYFSRVREYYPRHGPGAVAEGISGSNSKYFFNGNWPHRLVHHFPYNEFAFGRAYHSGDNLPIENQPLTPFGSETPCRVISVPKTQSGPRIISIEPVAVQYCQQALNDLLITVLKASPLWKSFNFDDQTVNRRAALSASQSGDFCTIDLKEASDRIHRDLVYSLFNTAPSFRDAAFDCRSVQADVPFFGIIDLYRFASMGSALCFPVEALVFWSIIASRRFGQLLDVGESYTDAFRDVIRYMASILVYGDDIIVPTNEGTDICDYLESFGLKVNLSKTHRSGKFRESCGMDAFNGHEVTPAYLKCFPSNVRSLEDEVELLTFSNTLYQKGWWRSVKLLRSRLSRFPYVFNQSGSLGHHCFFNINQVDSFRNGKYTFRGYYHSKPVKLKDPIDGVQAFLKTQLSPSLLRDKDHLKMTDRRGGGNYKSRWFSF